MDLRSRVARLTPDQLARLTRRLDETLGESDSPRGRSLVGYVETDPGTGPGGEELRRVLADRLPAYMVPSTIVCLETLPRTATGKVDRKALPDPEPQTTVIEPDAIAPRTEAEETLSRIWSEVLRVDYVAVNDDFFELGGDSILSIRIIARANEAGLRITPKQFFDSPTVAQLAALAATDAAPETTDEGPVSGPVPLTPIQHWFFDHVKQDPHHWNHAAMLEVGIHVDTTALERALAEIVNHHDALRLRYTRGDDGWSQELAPPGADPPFEVHDLAARSGPEQDATMLEVERRLHTDLDLARAPLVQAALFDRGPDRSALFLLVVHHLVIDGISWDILIQDLERAYRQLAGGETVSLPAKTVSFPRWAEMLREHVEHETVRARSEFWLRGRGPHDLSCPVDLPVDPDANTRGSTDTVTVILGQEETDALLREVPKAYRSQVNDALLTALAMSFSSWTDSSALLVDLEGHGRDTVPGEADVSRTVGWFTNVYPVLLTHNSDSDPGEALKSTKEQLRRIPGNGGGHGLLRYMAQDTGTADGLSDQRRPEVCFNYLGQRETTRYGSWRLEWLGGARPAARSGRADRPYLLEVDAIVEDGALHARFTYGTLMHRRATIDTLAEGFVAALRSLIAHCASGAGGVTPSDFPLAGLDQAELDRVAGLLGGTDDAEDSS